MTKPLPEESGIDERAGNELLRQQLQGLATLYKSTRAQNELLEEILAQQEAQTRMLSNLGNTSERVEPVRIENINMPFVALVGFILKVSIASIPAAIIFYAIAFLVAATLLSGVLGAGGILGSLFGG